MKIEHKDYGWLDGKPNHGDKFRYAWGGTFTNGVLSGKYGSTIRTYIAEDLTEIKAAAVLKVNPEAERRIVALNWKKERATEQPALYSLPDVLAERQAIRDASNQAKIDIAALTIIEEVKVFTW